jgi:hypothetical protein
MATLASLATAASFGSVDITMRFTLAIGSLSASPMVVLLAALEPALCAETNPRLDKPLGTLADWQYPMARASRIARQSLFSFSPCRTPDAFLCSLDPLPALFRRAVSVIKLSVCLSFCPLVCKTARSVLCLQRPDERRGAGKTRCRAWHPTTLRT